MDETTARAASAHSFGTMVAATLGGSALVHATVVEEHLTEWAPAGVFFLLLVALETVLGVVALRVWNAALAWLVATSSLVTVATWTLSRTSGMPLGPEDFRSPEPVGVPDLACCGLEVVAAALALWFLWSRRARRDQRNHRNHDRRTGPPRALVVATVLAAVIVTVAGALPALRSGHASHHDPAASATR